MLARARAPGRALMEQARRADAPTDMVSSAAATIASWSQRHGKLVLAGWFLAAIVAAAMYFVGPYSELEGPASAAGESSRALAAQERHPSAQPEPELVVLKGRAPEDTQLLAAVRAVEHALRAEKGVRKILPPDTDEPGIGVARRSADGRHAVVAYQLRAKADAPAAEDAARRLVDRFEAIERKHPGLAVNPLGEVSADVVLTDTVDADFVRAEKRSLMITAVVLLLSFGTIVAAGVPLLVGAAGVVVTLGMAGLVSFLAPADMAADSVILLVGLAVGVDYSLFYVHRVREERSRGRSIELAVEAAARTSGHAVLVSGLVVTATMASLLLLGFGSFTSVAAVSMLSVAVALCASVTLVPVILTKLGDRLERGRLPWHRDAAAPSAGKEERPFWFPAVRFALRRPALASLVVVALLLVLALPALDMQTQRSSLRTMPDGISVVDANRHLQEAFGEAEAAAITVEADDVASPAVSALIAHIQRVAVEVGAARAFAEVEVSRDGQLATLSLPIPGSGTDDASKQAIGQLRTNVVPRALAAAPQANATVLVGGPTAEGMDFRALVNERFPLVLAFVCLACLGFLLWAFRSVVLPAKAIVMNLLSIGAAYGVLVSVFQKGHGASLVGLDSPGPIVTWVPVFMFVVLSGLSMDYHVFVLSRVREHALAGAPTRVAVELGIAQTAGVVTRAAIVMIGVFAAFTTLGSIEFKQLAVGMAAAILVDATLVRCVLLPASMVALDRWNWYLPSWLEWIPGGDEADDKANSSRPASTLAPSTPSPVLATATTTPPLRHLINGATLAGEVDDEPQRLVFRIETESTVGIAITWAGATALEVELVAAGEILTPGAGLQRGHDHVTLSPFLPAGTYGLSIRSTHGPTRWEAALAYRPLERSSTRAA